MKRYLVALLVLFSSIPFPQWGYAANTDIFALQGGGTYNNVDVFRVDPSGNVYISSFNSAVNIAVPHTVITNQGVMTTSSTVNHLVDINMLGQSDINFGSLTVAQSTTNTTQTGQGSVYTAFLASGTANIAALEGSVLCSTTVQQGNLITVVVCPSSGSITSWIGIADTAASTGAVVNVISGGAWTLALTTGTVNPGDTLVTTSTAAGYLVAVPADRGPNIAGAQVATALGSNTSGTPGTTKVRLR